MAMVSNARANVRRAALAKVTASQDGLTAACAAAVLEAICPSAAGFSAEVDVVEFGDAASVVLASVRALRHAGLVDVVQTPDHTLRIAPRPGAERVLGVLAEHARWTAELAGSWDWSDHASIAAASGQLRRAAGVLAERLAAPAGLPVEVLDRARAHLDGVHDTIVLPRLTAADANIGPDGQFLAVYGLAGSYAEPLLSVALDPLADHSPDVVNERVDRSLNILASGAAHRPYFLAARAAIRPVFDHLDFASQPSVIVDTGCGDGTWLREIHRFVREQTSRGQVLDRFPLALVGVDLSPVAVDTAGRSLESLGGTAFLGDIGEPEGIVEQVERHTGVGGGRQLHIRAFIDHNRALRPPRASSAVPSIHGPFGRTMDGLHIPAAQVVDDWVVHLERWRQVLGDGGEIIVIEAHTPTVETPHGFGFEYYHALSGQSPLPWEDFSAVVPISGARFVEPPQVLSRNGFAAVSVSRISGRESHDDGRRGGSDAL